MYDLLKIKITSIAEEQRIIHAQERKKIRAARRLRIRLALHKSGLTDTQIKRLLRRADKLDMKRVLVPLTDSQKFIDEAMRLHDSMKGHRYGLTKVQRAAYIAYGYLRGKPFKSIEQFSYTAPPWEAALYHIKKFGDASQIDQVVAQKFAQWIDEAGDWKVKPVPKADSQ